MLPKRDYLVACHKHCKNHPSGWVIVNFSPSTADVTKQFENLTPLDFTKPEDKPPFQAIAVELAPAVDEDTLRLRMKTIRSLLAENGTIILIGQRPSWNIYAEAGLNINYFLVGLNVILLTTGNTPALTAANLYGTHFNHYDNSPVLAQHFEKVCTKLSLLRSTYPNLSTLSLSILANFDAYLEHRNSRWVINIFRNTTYSDRLRELGAMLANFHEHIKTIAEVNQCFDDTIRELPSRRSEKIEEDHIKLDAILLEGKQAFNFLATKTLQKEHAAVSSPAL